jgi:uncharacterized Zn finger protein
LTAWSIPGLSIDLFGGARRGFGAGMASAGIANILHRDTIAALVGGKAFDRGQQCFQAGRVLGVEAAGGELCGLVRPQEAGRAPYEVRIWVREDGVAFECTCPIGSTRQFCKHTVAVTLAHLEKERRRAEAELASLREQLMSVSLKQLLDGLLEQARLDPAVHAALRQVVSPIE